MTMFRVDIKDEFLDEGEEEVIPDPSNKNGCYLVQHMDLSDLVLEWLGENCKDWHYHEDSVNYPAGVDFAHRADALLFKLTFG